MKIKSPLSDLCEVLAQVSNSISQQRKNLEDSEAATRSVLIDPVLRALGWDTTNTQMVGVERTYKMLRADYLLKSAAENEFVVVEAKKLASPKLEDAIDQALTYALHFGAATVVITDGAVWMHLSSLTLNPKGYKVDKINLADETQSPVQSAAKLVSWLDAAQFWQTDTTSALQRDVESLQGELEDLRRIIRKQQERFDALSVSAGKDEHALQPALVSSVPTPLAAGSTKPHHLLKNFSPSEGDKPESLCLPDSSVVPMNGKWTSCAVEACRFVLANTPGLVLPLSDWTGGSRFLITFTAPPPDKAGRFRKLEYDGVSYFIGTNYDAAGSLANARYALSKLPASVRQQEAAIILR